MSVDACAALVERGDPDRFLAAMAAPVAARAVLFPLYAFNLEVARAPWVVSEPMLAEMRLQWWRDTVAEAAAGGKVQAHEVATPLADVIRTHDLPGQVLDDLITARQWDIYRDPFENAAHFERYINATAGGLMGLSVRALGGGDDASARAVGYAGGVANWLLAVPEFAARGCIPLVDDRPNAIAELAKTALADLNAHATHRFGPATPAIRAAWRARPILTRAIKTPTRVAEGRLSEPEILRRLNLMRRVVLDGFRRI